MVGVVFTHSTTDNFIFQLEKLETAETVRTENEEEQQPAPMMMRKYQLTGSYSI